MSRSLQPLPASKQFGKLQNIAKKIYRMYLLALLASSV